MELLCYQWQMQQCRYDNVADPFMLFLIDFSALFDTVALFYAYTL